MVGYEPPTLSLSTSAQNFQTLKKMTVPKQDEHEVARVHAQREKSAGRAEKAARRLRAQEEQRIALQVTRPPL